MHLVVTLSLTNDEDYVANYVGEAGEVITEGFIVRDGVVADESTDDKRKTSVRTTLWQQPSWFARAHERDEEKTKSEMGCGLTR